MLRNLGNIENYNSATKVRKQNYIVITKGTIP